MNRSATANARLHAVAKAKELHRELDIQRRTLELRGCVDVFKAITELDIPLLFKPLCSALGFCIPKPLGGIMVTTTRGLHIQRFTAAHELGHLMLDHAGSVDSEILERDPFGASDGENLQEIAAEAFAAEFLLPRWLYKYHVQNQGWSIQHDLCDPDVVYQLSLRMGASFAATYWGLVGHQILTYAQIDRLRNARVSQLKSKLGGEYRPGDPWSDVWLLTQKDSGAPLTANPDDLLRIELEEHASSGYKWETSSLVEAGYEVLSERSEFSREPLVYGISRRVLFARPPCHEVDEVVLHESQPWVGETFEDSKFSIALTYEGPEKGGLSRAVRRKLVGRPS